MPTTEIHVSTTRWNTPVENVDGIKAYYFGDVKDDANLLAVVLGEGGGCRFYCKKHRRIFHPVSDCPECSGAVATHAAPTVST